MIYRFFFIFLLSLSAVSGVTALPGDFDLNFGNSGKVITDVGGDLDEASSIIIQPDGKIIVVGYSVSLASFSDDFALVRYNSDGTIDQSFGNSGKVTTDFDTNFDFALSANLQTDGKIVVVGNTALGFAIVRYNSNGSLDTSFDNDGKSTITFNNSFGNISGWTSAIQSDGKIIVAGSVKSASNYDFALARLNFNGSVDTSFGTNGRVTTSFGALRDEIRSIKIQPDGKIVAAGFASNGVNYDFALARYNVNGLLDNSFDGDGKVLSPLGNGNDLAYSLAIQNDGKLLLAGQKFTGTDYDFALARYNPNGSIDAQFGVSGSISTSFGSSNDCAYSVEIQQNGKIIASGYTGNMPNRNFALSRYDNNGFLDSTFNGTGKVISDFGSSDEAVSNLKLQPDGKIVVSGFRAIQNNGSTADFIVARYEGDNIIINKNTSFDYDGDGKSDISIFRPSNRVWYIQNSANNSYNIQQFGLSEDLIAPADYDGDGKTDIAVYRPSSGVWYWLNSSNNGFSAVKFGIAGDVPVPADYDGDNKADLAVFRPSSGVWYRLNSSNNQSSAVSFGLSEDKPTIGDFDGDGKSDIAVWRPSNGVWYRINSGSGSLSVQSFGLAGDQPVPADYDGDGKTDVSIFRPGDGKWYRLNSSTNSYEVVSFGLPEDNPVAADYDGDGKSDVAVFRPSTGTWYFLRSTQGFLGIQFGLNADIAAPNAFVR